MIPKDNYPAEHLRKRAEEALSKCDFLKVDGFNHIKDYVHELQVYQIELEMQAEELRCAQAELEKSRDVYSSLYDHAPIGYFSINSTGFVIKSNLTFARMLGVAREKLIHKPLSQFIQPKDHTLFYAVCRNAAKSKEFQTCELCFRKADTQSFYGRLDIKPKKGSSPVKYRVSLVDITDKKRSEEEKIRLERAVLNAQKEDSLRRLAGGIAHNFNNILTIGMGNIELAKDVDQDHQSIKEHLDTAYQSLVRASDLSSMMLYYLGQVPANSVSIDLTDTVQTLFAIIRRTIHGNLELNYETGPGPINIMGDPVQVAQILNNLITNAVEAIGPHKGELTVRLSQKRISSKTQRQSPDAKHLKIGEYACLEVYDTGCGMDSKTIEHAVDPFFTTKFTGRGLGLSAVSGIVSSHSGYLNIESKAGHGTAVKIFLPIYHQPAEPKSLEASKEKIPTESIDGMTFLYVDDDQIVRHLGKSLLEKKGGIVLEAKGGKEGVEILRSKQGKIDCAILDFAMPDQDGNLTLIELRQIQQNLPVLLVSGYLKHQMKDLFSKEKPDGFLQKPFNFHSFINAVEMVLNTTNTSW